METYQVVALGLTLGLTVVCFIIWVWQMMVKRRKLEDEVAQMKQDIASGDEASETTDSTDNAAANQTDKSASQNSADNA